MKIIFLFLLVTSFILFIPTSAHAIVDPLSSPNNKYGIHLISSTTSEASEAASLVNSSGGDFGYVTVLIESKNRDKNRWQEFFNDLRRRHLIPIVRLATSLEGVNWKRPSDGEEKEWAEFLDSLNWPTQNRYVVIFNEPNHSKEWGGQVDPITYAQTLDKYITALKNESDDFFILNAGLDASTPHEPPNYYDEVEFLKAMEQAVPGIFNKLDGWVSHSYPNPGFVGSPNDTGRGSIRTFEWEQNILKQLGVNKDLPIFITETGWQHAEGTFYNKSLPTSEKIGEYFKVAFTNAWDNLKIVAITPFLLNYQTPPFDHFSFKKLTGEKQNQKVLGEAFPNFYPHYQVMVDLQKQAGKPIQENSAELLEGSIYASIVAGESYDIPLTFINTGQSIWNDIIPLQLKATSDLNNILINQKYLTANQKVEPKQKTSFNLNLNPSTFGTFNISLQLYEGDITIPHPPIEFKTQVKSEVIISVKSGLSLKTDPAGDYIIYFRTDKSTKTELIKLNSQGKSQELTERSLLPDQEYEITLEKAFYKPKILRTKVLSGLNTLDFGELQPDFLTALPHPKEFWHLLPLSN